MTFERTLNEDFALAPNQDDELCVFGEDGELIFTLSDEMNKLFTDCPGYCDEILIYVAVLLVLEKDKWWESGKRHGAEDNARQIQQLFGLDKLERIAEAIEEIAGRN